MKRNIIILGLVLLGFAATGRAQQMTKLTADWTAVIGRWEVDKKGVISGGGFLKYDNDVPDAFLFRAGVLLRHQPQGCASFAPLTPLHPGLN